MEHKIYSEKCFQKLFPENTPYRFETKYQEHDKFFLYPNKKNLMSQLSL